MNSNEKTYSGKRALDLRLIALSFAVNVAGKRNVRRWMRAGGYNDLPVE